MRAVIWFCSLVALLGGAELGRCAEPVEYAPIVKLNDGQVRGVVQKTEDGQKVHNYIGIRYGRAERFTKPKPVAPWNGVYNATEWRDACPQTGFDKQPFGPESQTHTMSEDCLFVSVWRPVEEKVNRSVLFWMHGGSFEHGTIFSELYDGRYLAGKGDVIVVTVNYRLGLFGWMSGGTPEFPGNWALHDQILALKWVHENIHHFGGDANSVTVFGESSGGFSVSAFILSPLTKGLVRRAILQSGAPTSVTTNEATKPVNRTLTMAKLVHCESTDNVTAAVHCLRNRTVAELLEAQKIATLVGQGPYPVLGDEVLPEHNCGTALKEGKYNRDIDLMYGVTKDEGSIFVAGIFSDLNSNETILTINSTRDHILAIHGGVPEKLRNEIADFYTGNLHNPSQDQLRLIVGQALGDPNLICSTVLFGEHVAKLAPTNHYYAYQVTQAVTITFPILGGCDGWKGVCHGEDVIYLYGTQLLADRPAEYELSKAMIRAWTNFAKTGAPGKMGSVEWSPAVNGTNQYSQAMNLNSKDYRMVSNLFKRTCNEFWQPKIFF